MRYINRHYLSIYIYLSKQKHDWLGCTLFNWVSWVQLSRVELCRYKHPTPLVVTRQLQVECRTGKARRPKTNVLPLCHATGQMVTAAGAEDVGQVRRRHNLSRLKITCIRKVIYNRSEEKKSQCSVFFQRIFNVLIVCKCFTHVIKCTWFPCGGLSWLPVSFLLHVKYTLYRIVSWFLYLFDALAAA